MFSLRSDGLHKAVPLQQRAVVLAFLLAGCTTVDSSGSAVVERSAPAARPPPARAVPPPAPFAALQYLYGSGEGAAASIQAYAAFRDYVVATARSRPSQGVVLAERATLAAPAFVPCGTLPLAVVLDVDETAIQNLGYQYDRDVRGVGFDEPSWAQWEQTGAEHLEAMPGAVEAIRAIRNSGVTVVFSSNRLARYASYNERALNDLGLGPVEFQRTLWLQDPALGGARKDQRRALISRSHCVIAMAGDQLGDFSDLFRISSVRERRNAASASPFFGLWGNGWFILPNPVYGSSLAGNRDEVFSPSGRWTYRENGE